MDSPIETVAAPELPKSVQLNEDAQLRVLSGRTTYIAEAKKKAEADEKEKADKKEEAVKEEMKVGDSKKTAKGGTVTKTKTGIVHKAGPGNYGGSDDKDTDPDADDEPKAKKAKKESIDPEVFKSKFLRMVEAKKSGKKKPDDDNDGVPDWADKKPGEDDNAGKKKGAAPKKGVNPFAKKKVKEASDDDADFDNISHGVSSPEEKKKQEKSMIDTFKKSGKKANPDSQIGRLMKKHGVSLESKESVVSELSKDTLKSYKAKNMDAGRSAMIKGDEKTLAKRTAGKDAVEKKLAKKDESKMMPKGKKRPVKESVEPTLTFKDMVRLVQESGGQQQIDAVDTALFNWAQRVAKNKLGEGMKAELYAGLIYERNGGVFEMYDVLSESKKNINESRVQLDEGMMDKVKSMLMSKLAPKLSDQEKSKMANVAKQVLGKDRADSSDFTLANIKAIAKALGAKPEPAAESIEEGPIGDFFGQKKVDPKSGQGTLGGIDAWDKSATLGEKLSSLTGVLGGAAATIAGLFGGPAWLIIPGILAIMFMSQIGMSKGGSS